MTNTTSNYQRAARMAREDGVAHLFAVGQAVRLKGGFAQPSRAPGIYHVTRTLPPRGGSPQYHIRNEDERHERLASQDELEAVNASSDGEGGGNLMARTFGHG